MLSLFARRVAAARGTPATILRAPFAALDARRTFLTAAAVAFPVKGTTAGATKAAPKKAATKAEPKKTATSKAAPKSVGAPKRKVAARKKPGPKPKKVVKKAVPPKIKITAEDMPPKGPPSAFILFSSKLRKGQDPAANLEQTQQKAKDAGRTWHALTDHEKQAFKDESVQLRVEYEKRRDAYWASADPAKIRELNKRRVKAGKSRFTKPKPEAGERRPLTSYFRYAQEFRESPAAAGLSLTEASKQSGAAWFKLSEAEKKPYVDASDKDLAAWHAKKAAPTAGA